MNRHNKEAQEKLIKEAESLSILLRSLNQGIFQIREKSLIVLSFLLFTTVSLVVFFTFILKIDIQTNYLLAGVFTLVLLCFVGFIKLQKLTFNQSVGFVVVITCIVFYVLAVFINKVDPLYYLSALLLLISIMITPWWSLIFSFGLIGLQIYTLITSSVENRQVIRMVVDSLTVVLIMQVVMRERSMLGVKTATIIDKLRELSVRLSLNLSEITKQRNDAISKDFQTGLLTGHSLKKELLDYIEEHPTEKIVLCSIRILQLDEFLIINNSKFNDHILGNLINKLELFFQPNLIARTSKGEFVGVLKEAYVDESSEKNIQQSFEQFQNSFDIKNESLLSIQRMGVAIWPQDAKTVEELISNSNMAFLKAIEIESSVPVYYHDQMSTDLQKTVKLASEIEEAIKENQFELFFQPIVYRNPHNFRKVEALLRWNHPQLGLLGPHLFIPLATNNGSIIKLTNWVLEQSIQKLQILQSENSQEFRVSINFPPECLNHCLDNPDYLEYLKSFGSSIRGIVLEITEGALLYVTPEVLGVIWELKKIGFQLALDDFGIGYSSLSQLNNLPFDYLKIDKSLIDNIESSAKSLLICKFITQLAHEFNCEVISEGVENSQQLSLLDGVGMDFVQGYVYSKPIQFEALRKFTI